MKFKIEIDCGNDAFVGCAEDECVRILQELRERLCSGDAATQRHIPLFDLNGNKVGEARFVR